jgi:hypothetical protein
VAESGGNTDAVNLTTKWGGLSLVGKDALDIFLFIAILALGAVTIWEHIQRSNEHDTISCQLKLTLYMQTQPLDKPMDWRRMPTDVFNCVPKFLYERDVAAGTR